MATKKTTKKSTPKKVVKAEVKKTATKKTPKKVESKAASFYNKDVSLLFAITVEALILILGYLIIMSNA